MSEVKEAQPMLCAQKAKFTDVAFPAYVSTKLDGIRLFVKDGIVWSKSMKKPIPNREIQEMYGHSFFDGLDGEGIVGPPNLRETTYRTSHSVIMSEGKSIENLVFYAFDDWKAPGGFQHRQLALARRLPQTEKFHLVEQVLVNSLEELQALYASRLDEGYEGLVTRCPNGPYKFGRSTLKENWAIKLKPKETSEARIVGWYELMHNNNDSRVLATGLSARGYSQENLVPGDTLGGFDVVDIHTGVDFRLGGGTAMTEKFRKEVWELIKASPEKVRDRIVRYSYFPIGIKERPRHPQMDGFRDTTDI